MSSLRVRMSQLVWLLGLLCALVLAAGALIVAVTGADAQHQNWLVRFVLSAADHLDFGALSDRKALIDLSGADESTKETMANWGVAAVIWVVLGWGLSIFLRPEAVQRGQRV
ncbi:conserved exported hypothetical protein [metagenome]|uniref:Transmembrane protein n=1 Tax=metagenome TaxID=256318 RepID=A0A2P2C248_9ZZZZ